LPQPVAESTSSDALLLGRKTYDIFNGELQAERDTIGVAGNESTATGTGVVTSVYARAGAISYGQIGN
jgi:dihydrofolate reductase